MDNFSNGKAERREEIKAIYESKRQEIELRLYDFTKNLEERNKERDFY